MLVFLPPKFADTVVYTEVAEGPCFGVATSRSPFFPCCLSEKLWMGFAPGKPFHISVEKKEAQAGDEAISTTSS